MTIPCHELKAAVSRSEVKSQVEAQRLNLGWHAKPDPFHPFDTIDTITVPLLHLVFNSLVRWTRDGRFEGDLAESWKISQDGKTYLFKLRDNIYFHDGHRLDAEDVIHSLEFHRDPEKSPRRYQLYELIQSMRMVSSQELEIKISEPNIAFLDSLWHAIVVPKHRLENFNQDIESFVVQPIGSGPMRFIRDDAQGVSLSAFDNYFEENVKLEDLKVRTYDSKRQVWSAFMRNEIDALFYLNLQDYGEIENHQHFQVFKMPSVAMHVLIFNLSDPWLAKPDIRKAISLAIDCQALIDEMEEGEGARASGPFQPNSWANNPDVPLVDYDPSQASALLLKAGFLKRDGIFESDGEPFSFELLVDLKNEQLYRIAKLLRQQLYEAGILVKIISFSDPEEFKKLIYQEKPDFQLHLYTPNSGPHPYIAMRYWGSGNSLNRSHYSNFEVDALIERAESISSQEQQKKIYHEVHEIIARDNPAVFLYVPFVFHAFGPHVKNVESITGSFLPFHLLAKIYVEKS